MPDFLLDERLERDTLPVAGPGLCRLLLMNDRRWPWLILVPERDGIVELFDLSPGERGVLVEEAARAASVLKAVTGAGKTNVATLGNVVRQFHLHVVARRPGDGNWPGPVWGFGEPVAYRTGEAEPLIAALADALRPA